MFRTISIAACAVALVALAGVADAQVIQGNVIQVDPRTGVIVLDGGQAVHVNPGTQIIVGGQPARLETIQPGTAVVIQQAPPAAQSPTTIQVAPPVAQVPVLRQTVTGIVTDVDSDGEVTSKSNDGDEFEVRVTRAVAANIKKGDGVTIDLNFHSPSASPRLR
jgi:hypothetical protein